MESRRHDMVGTKADADTGSDRALAGSYGRPPSGYRLPSATRLGAVALQVSHLARSLEYYQHLLGLAVLAPARRHHRATRCGVAPAANS
jgi:catechol-2,3-dioxygenase